MTATEARVHSGERLRLVGVRGPTIAVEHRGEPAVTFVSVVAYERVAGTPLPATREPVRLTGTTDVDEAPRLGLVR